MHPAVKRWLPPQPQPEHETHCFVVRLRFDGHLREVTIAACMEGLCIWGRSAEGYIARYADAGIELASLPITAARINSLDNDHLLQTMIFLKVAEHEGRQNTIEYCRATLAEYARSHYR